MHAHPHVERDRLALHLLALASFLCCHWKGLGIPGLSKEAAEKESLKRALAESCSSAHQVFPGEPSAFFKGGRGAHDSFGTDFGDSDLQRALAESCSSAHQVFPGESQAFLKGGRATQEELEQAVRTMGLSDTVASSVVVD